MSPLDYVLTVVFVVLLVGFPAFTWWETKRAYRSATALLDFWEPDDAWVDVDDDKAYA